MALHNAADDGENEMTTKPYIALCQRCNGTGRYDRGACFGCKLYGSAGWIRRASKSVRAVQVTAVRDDAEGRINWLKIYDATPSQAAQIVQRQMRLVGKPAALIDSVKAQAA